MKKWYGRAIKKHQGNPKAAATEIGTTLIHIGSTDEDPRYWDCPIGDCYQYQWADHRTAGTLKDEGPSHDVMNHRLPRDLCDQLSPLYASAFKLELYETQFPNEVWKTDKEDCEKDGPTKKKTATGTNCKKREKKAKMVQKR